MISATELLDEPESEIQEEEDTSNIQVHVEMPQTSLLSTPTFYNQEFTGFTRPQPEDPTNEQIARITRALDRNRQQPIDAEAQLALQNVDVNIRPAIQECLCRLGLLYFLSCIAIIFTIVFQKNYMIDVIMLRLYMFFSVACLLLVWLACFAFQ
jgi:hypothetical protein